MTNDSSRTVSIIVEWENVRVAEMERCCRMLRQLDMQTRELGAYRSGTRFELLILFNYEEVAESDVRTILERCFEAGNSYVDVTLLPVEGLPYFEQKNYGAQQAKGSLIIFVDSDVVPNEGWLENIVGSFDCPDIRVVGGNAYIDPESLYAKAFALFWFFPLRMSDSGLRKSKYFFANNVAFRAETFLRFRFPARREVSRGAHINPRCQVSHPAPKGFSHFVRRGVAEGRDRWFNLKLTHPHKASLLRALGRFFKSSWRGIRSIARFRRRVGLSRLGAPVAALLAVVFYGVCLCGEILTRISPDYMRTHFHV